MEIPSGVLALLTGVVFGVAFYLFNRLQMNKQAELVKDGMASNNELVIATRELTTEIRDLKSVLKDKK